MLNLTLIQANLSWEDSQANFQRFDQHLSACQADTDVIVLPEMFSTGFSMNSHGLAEVPEGPTHQWMQNWADQLDAAITGSYIVKDGEAYYNRLLWIEPGGHFHYYDKHHLFGMAGETEAFSAGQERLNINWRGWNIRPLICYDLRFPEWSRNTAPYYDLLIYVASWPSTRADHWRNLLQARAIENLSYVVGLNRVGVDQNKLSYQGDSSLYDYSGNLLSRMVRQERMLHCSISKEALDAYRKKLPFLADIDIDL